MTTVAYPIPVLPPVMRKVFPEREGREEGLNVIVGFCDFVGGDEGSEVAYGTADCEVDNI